MRLLSLACDAGAVAGLVSITIGLALAWPPAAWLFAGTALTAGSFFFSMSAAVARRRAEVNKQENQ